MMNPTASMLVIGDEILSGRTRESNMNFLAIELSKVGIDLKEVRIVRDYKPAIISAVINLSSSFDLVFTSGGIGPTHDDITSECMAEAFNRSLEIHKDARNKLEDYYRELGKKLNSSRLGMARIPKGAELIENSVSAAPGFSIGNVHVMAGIPKVFQAMVSNIIKTLKKGTPTLSKTIKLSLAEGEIAYILEKLSSAYPELSIGSYPFVENDEFGVDIVVRGERSDLIDQFINNLEAKIESIKHLNK
jgi:molybdenum cofactor synthesis domain-containing protein|tara:strand:+ start:26 stop:766 length:741 start_codon:yes stop_codon:yes gene_type:complete